MFRTINDSPTLWDAILPECCLGLPAGLAEVDGLLDDPRLFEPFRPFFSARHGRPLVPMETYIEMMVLKYRYRLGFETTCAEVSGSIAWRRFCRIALDAPVPHPSTLEKITSRVGETAIAGLKEVLLAKAVESKLLRADAVRAEATVIPANVAYPSDAGLLGKGGASLDSPGRTAQVHGFGQKDQLSGPHPVVSASCARYWRLAEKTLRRGQRRGTRDHRADNIWCAWGVAAHNSFKIAALATDTTGSSTAPTRSRPPRPPGSGPPTGPPDARPAAV